MLSDIACDEESTEINEESSEIQNQNIICVQSCNASNENETDLNFAEINSDNEDINCINNDQLINSDEHCDDENITQTDIVSDENSDELLSDSSSEDFTNDSFNDNDKNNYFEREMFSSSKLTVRDIIVMTQALSLRHHLSDEARLAIIVLLKQCAGPNFYNFNISRYMINLCSPVREREIIYHYYCTHCSTKIFKKEFNEKTKNKTSICENCQQSSKITNRSPNYFTIIDLSYQLKELLLNDEFFSDIINNISTRTDVTNDTSNVISDIYDGIIFKKIMQLPNEKQNYYTLSLNFNTDGAPLTKSGKRGFWPLQVILNELSPKLRWQYILIGGLLTVEKEPDNNLMKLYMSEFSKQIIKLSNNGISIEKNNTQVLFKFFLNSCVVDSVCRPIIQNRLQFNGYFGCSWCYQVGCYNKEVSGIRYIFEQRSQHRSNESHNEDVKNAIEFQKYINGVKGVSALIKVPHLDMIWSFSYEYMHGLLLGVTNQIWNEWKKGKTHYKIEKKFIKMIEKRYLTIKPNKEIHRLPRSGIIVGSAKPKASELKSWLLYYSLPCLTGILDEECINHYALLVKSSYTLLKTNITKSDLDECEKDLIEFVGLYEALYGAENMTFNVHSLIHVCESIRQTGPLVFNSAFPFESYIYNLKNYVNGPNGMDKQMVRKHLQTFTLKSGNIKNVSIETKNYCMNLFMPKRLKSLYMEGDNVIFIGRGYLTKFDENGETCYSYAKCIFEGIVYHSLDYKRATKTDDTVIQLQSGNFVRIVQILNVNDQCYLNVSPIETFTDNPFPGVDHIKKIKQEHTEETETIPITIIKRKIILLNVRNARYVCLSPNNVEIQ